MLEVVWRWVDATAKALATLTAFLALVVFLCPPAGTWLNLITAWRFGVKGYTYYEIGARRAITTDGQYYLTRDGPGTYEDVRVGDKLQSATKDGTFIRDRPSKDGISAAIFEVRQGDCVVVLAKDHSVKVEHAVSGGWLLVATAACGLFK